MIHDIFMPALSSTMTEGKIVNWVKSPGDKVEKGETVVVVESDKADMDVESFYEGYLATIIVNTGESAPVGETIALIAETEAEIETAKQQATTSGAPTASVSTAITQEVKTIETTPVAATTSNSTSGRIIASPRARKMAKELGIDWNSLQGSGPHGRIIAEDVEKAAGKTPQQPITTTAIISTPVATPTPSISVPPTPVVPVSIPAGGKIVPLNTLQQAVVRNMMASLQVPTFHVSYTITTDALDSLYKQIKSKGVTMTALIAKAVAVTLQKHPILNATYTDQGIQYHSNINVAIAVAMADGGLITPVLQNADQLDIYSLSRTWKDLVARSRVKQLQPQEYNSGTFTLSNLGMFGVDNFDAILPQGQGSILAIAASTPQVVATSEGMIGIKNQMKVNITCDHRIIYGADAASFLQDLGKLIETNPQSLTL